METIQPEYDFKYLDSTDPLRKFRDQFVISDPSTIYLDGNSLGRLPKKTVELLEKTVRDEWGTDLIESWNKSWYNKSQEIGDMIAKAIGAQPGEVIVADSTSINLYKVASAALTLQSDRNTILTDEFNFPSDIYIFQGLINDLTFDLKIDFLRSKDGITIADEEIRQKLDRKVGLMSLSHVAFKSAFMYNMEDVTRLAHDCGSLVLWDLSHSVGAVPIDLGKSGVDLAVGCTYKYLNGGPGAPAFIYVRRDLQDKLNPRVNGWFGVDKPFEFDLDFKPASGIRRFLTGTPSVLSMAAIKPGVELILDAGMDAIRKKSILMSDLFIKSITNGLSDSGYTLASPASADQRGSHVSIRHPQASRIIKALLDPSIDGYKIIPDFRTPDNIRFGFAPLYNSFGEIEITLQKLQTISKSKLYERYDDTMQEVT